MGENKLTLNITHRKIIDAIIKKSEIVCPGSLALIGVYGSACTGDLHEKSDLDLLILINDDAGWQLARGFILDDTLIGYDIYCTSWEMLAEEAECRHAHLAKLMDSEIVYAADGGAALKLARLREKAKAVLQAQTRLERVDKIVENAKKVYAEAMLSETISDLRFHGACCINLLLDAVMLENGKYFRRGVKRTFQELEGLCLPGGFAEHIYAVALAPEMQQLRQSLTELMRAVTVFTMRTNAKEPPSERNIAGTYEEMFSNWRNKMTEAAGKKDAFSSFMNLASLQYMINEIAEGVFIERISVMDSYDPADLEGNVRAFDNGLKQYLEEYEKAGISPRHYKDVEEFISSYLQV
ncbi:MAG: nucleotidyltransferase domain-containing protein [Acetatifactor sp.]|nr:nucleotidyltransferase domain-containing protein [Acetatifactor sp.]